MESNVFYGDFKVKLIERLSTNLIYHVFSVKAPDYLQANFIIES